MSRFQTYTKKQITPLTILTVITILVSFSVLSGCASRGTAGLQGEQAKPVRVTPMQIGLMEKVLSFTGTVEPVEKAEIFSKIPGKVEAVYCREGDRVAAGQVLVQIEDEDLKAAVVQAEAALEMAQARVSQARAGEGLQNIKTRTDIVQAQNAVNQAEAQYKMAKTDLSRMTNLFNEGAIPRQQLDVAEMNEEVSRKALDSARETLRLAKASVAQDRIRKEDLHVAHAGVSQAEAMLLTARTQLGYARIISPIAGVVTFRGVEPGEMICASTMMRAAPLLKVVDNSEVTIEASVPEKDISLFAEGRPVRILIDALKPGKFSGKVTTLVPAADRQSRSFRVKVSPLSCGEILKSGMFARIQVVSYRNPRALLITREALLDRDGKKVLFVVDKNVAHMKEVKPGTCDEKNYEIVSGVGNGDLVVTAGQTILNDGDMVNVEGGERP